jgi:plasmid stabilization system protein ParE
LKQLLFGIGRRATHRVVFIIENNQVTVLRVRHSAQDALTLEDLP